MIQAPTHCPSCNSTLTWVKDQLYCYNTDCPAKGFKQLEHFSKTLKIKGLGPVAIEKLDLQSVEDIYALTQDYIAVRLGSERIAEKLFSEIERSKTEPLNTVLPALGIPLVGKSVTDKLAQTIEYVWDIDTAACKQAGLGPKVTGNLLNWLANKLEDLVNLPFDWKFSNNTRPTGSNGVVCISGKLKSYPTKAAAKAVLESLGYTVKDSLTKEVTILVNESGVESAKTIKAANSGVRVINNLKELTENN